MINYGKIISTRVADPSTLDAFHLSKRTAEFVRKYCVSSKFVVCQLSNGSQAVVLTSAQHDDGRLGKKLVRPLEPSQIVELDADLAVYENMSHKFCYLRKVSGYNVYFRGDPYSVIEDEYDIC